MTRAAPLRSRRAFCLGAAGLACAGLAGVRRAAAVASVAGADASARWLAPPVLPDVPLLDQNGRAVRLQRDLIAGRTVIVNFMFTGCQTVCPPQTALLREARRQLQAVGATRDLLVLSITVDPLADGPAQLRAFGERYELPMGRDQGWMLLTGQPADIARLLTAFDVPASAPGDHPSLLWIGDATRGRWTRASSLNPPDTLVALVQELRR